MSDGSPQVFVAANNAKKPAVKSNRWQDSSPTSDPYNRTSTYARSYRCCSSNLVGKLSNQVLVNDRLHHMHVRTDTDVPGTLH